MELQYISQEIQELHSGYSHKFSPAALLSLPNSNKATSHFVNF